MIIQWMRALCSRRCRSLRIRVLAAVTTLCCLFGPIFAQRRDEVAVVPRVVEIDWQAVARDARGLSARLSIEPRDKSFSQQHQERVARRLERFSVKEDTAPLAHLNELVAEAYPGLPSVPVPVLLPVDTPRLLSERLETGRLQRQALPKLLGAPIGSMELFVGLSGYDAILTVDASKSRRLGIDTWAEPQLHIAGTYLSYGSYDYGALVADMQDAFPGLRRLLGENEVTYSFLKYGVPYFINTGCSRGTPAPGTNSLACADADVIIRAVLRELRLLGGGPMPAKPRAASAVKQTTKVSPDFKYVSPGKLLKGTGEGGLGGVTKQDIYGADIEFPIVGHPHFANSQVFLHGGDCLGQKVSSGPSYNCRQNPTKMLQDKESHVENYSYPWRDNYCESRGEEQPQLCPALKGHAGQDIRPSRCIVNSGNPRRCDIDIFNVIAVTNGKAWWKTGDHENNLRLNAEDGSNKLYYLYLHMSPKSLKSAGMKRGEKVQVKRGARVGMVGNFDHAKANETTAHLHFEIRRGDNVGVPLPPYMTLIRSYERRIQATGVEIPE